MRGHRIRMAAEHSCPDLDRRCPRCERLLWVTVELVDERGSFSTCKPCGCFVITATLTPKVSTDA